MPRLVDVTRTYLAIEHLEQLVAPVAPPEATSAPRLRLEALTHCSIPAWRALYAQIGGPWHWHDRDTWSDDALRTHLDGAGVHVYVVQAHDDTAEAPAGGMLELEQHTDGSVEIVYLGLDHRLMGKRLGALLVHGAVQEAFRLGATRVWLHTCTLDAPAALPSYLARGFVTTRTEQYQTTLPD
ncbi:MAG TPA: GNAT family N-acetyltransferase [Gemmatimonas sp.]|uniref:GNAT family N-acetyltransferase n=1 Tax=Gemmatimonas sp. TaxID=1962908 RepID=UPI002ED852A9